LEVSITSLVTSIMAAAIVTCLCFLASIANTTIDRRSSLDRAENVFAILKLPTAHCGYGMPKESEKFARAFKNIAASPFNWAGPASVTDFTSAGNSRKNAVCRLVYAIPTRIRTKRGTVVSGSSALIPTDGKFDATEAANHRTGPSSTKNWVVFGAALPVSCPFWLVAPPQRSAKETTFSLGFVNPLSDSSKELFIPENDEMCAVRAMECWAAAYKNDFALFSNNHVGSGAQPKVIGVIDARFEIVAPSYNLLRVFLITRGNKRYDYEISKTAPQGWPEQYAATIPPEARHYRLFAYRASFELKNF
jgi:hypothetical protein